MPSYHVQFTTPAGDAHEIALNAASLPDLALRLRQDGCTLTRVVPAAPDRVLKGYWKRISEPEVTTLLRQLAVMLNNGVALGGALGLAAREVRNPTLSAILVEAHRAVLEGDTLSHALSAYPRIFSPVYLRLLETGESSGSLPEVLTQLADYAERAGQAAQRIRTAMVYPQAVGGFTLVVMIAAFAFVVPKWLRLFEELGVQEYPLATRTLIWLSGAFAPMTAIALLIVLPLAIAFYRGLEWRSPFGLAELRARIPVVGVLYHNFALLRLTRLLAALLRGGVPVLEALRLAGQGAESRLIQAAMWDAIPHVAAGETLGTAFGHAGILPPTFCGQIAAAEAGGDLPSALVRLADWYSERVDFLAARVGALVEPVLILVLALLAGWIALGVFAPLVSIIQNLSGGG